MERANRTILDGLKAYADGDDQRDWDQQLPYLMLAYRTTEHCSTEHTPSKVLFGRELALPWHVVTPIPVKKMENDADETNELTSEDYVEKCRDHMEKGFNRVRRILRKNVKLRKAKYDCRVTPLKLTEGQEVWVNNPHRQVGVCNKLKRLWVKGHYVVCKHSDWVYEVENRKTGKKQNIHISRLFPVNQEN